MRRLAALVIAPVLLLAAACGSEGEDETTATASSSPSASASTAPVPELVELAADAPTPTVEGEPGEKPTISVPDAQPDGNFSYKVLTEGDGEAVQDGDYVTFQLAGFNWTTAQEMEGSTYETGGAQTTQIGASAQQQVIPALGQPMLGQPVGSRVLVVAPPTATWGTNGNEQLGVAPGDTMVFVLDIVDRIPSTGGAEGEMAESEAGMPTVTMGDAGPQITVPEGEEPPTELRQQVLIEGDGPVVEAGQQLVAQYTGALWSDGSVFDSSWERGSAATFGIGSGQVIAGWDEALVGKKAGDRVLLVIPPDKAYGDQENNGIPANSTLVFVVDILGSF
ncbi:FKBP-type peptidyl-prolyl cis-trans isomerase [Allostreptomyces psammosilenae]|uniref:peptidylprolyl isomerase n=1 Tax=Allostreptomyces psammosilenae TaxID=1892865 RepID=A0A853A0E8_9ACTN|nr:FKBP-type peptidyl-prolyl cis-trans isomerase [Allostreptomyces psammosilenae]NYI03992.1 peptidylprolyl isomerase [Allostreptomyces psammosilenae]